MINRKRLFLICSNTILIALTICVLVPFIVLISSSITEEYELIKNGYSLFPRKLDFAAYKYLLMDSTSIVQGYIISFLVLGIGTTINLVLTILMAYPLSIKDLPGRNIVAFYLFFTMLFNGGLISSYIMWTQTFHIKNTIYALIFPNLLMQGFNVIMMRTFFSSNIPDSVMEAARIDGAGELCILLRIVLPMSKPIIVTIGLMAGLTYWNDWMNGLYYVTDDRYYSIPVLLNKMLLSTETLKKAAKVGISIGQIPSIGIKMAIAVLGILPVMIIFPFLQRYFVKGITIGAVKG